jgi:adenylate kinase
MIKDNKKIILIIGPPGSGKTSISDKIRNSNISHFSIGEMYREISKEETPLGKIVKQNIDFGKFVPIKIAKDVMKEFIEKGHNKIIIDGFPRSIIQAEMFNNLLESTDAQLSKVIEISVNYDIAFKRISNRKRGVDDNEALFASRIELYETDISKIRAFYVEKQVYTKIDGNLPFEKVVNNLNSVVFPL